MTGTKQHQQQHDYIVASLLDFPYYKKQINRVILRNSTDEVRSKEEKGERVCKFCSNPLKFTLDNASQFTITRRKQIIMTIMKRVSANWVTHL